MESNQDLTHKSLETWQGVVSAIFLILLSCLFSFFLQQLKLPSQKCVFSVGMSRKAQLINQLHHPLGGRVAFEKRSTQFMSFIQMAA
jgi:hypothetical protein